MWFELNNFAGCNLSLCVWVCVCFSFPRLYGNRRYFIRYMKWFDKELREWLIYLLIDNLTILVCFTYLVLSLFTLVLSISLRNEEHCASRPIIIISFNTYTVSVFPLCYCRHIKPERLKTLLMCFRIHFNANAIAGRWNRKEREGEGKKSIREGYRKERTEPEERKRKEKEI